MSSALVHTGKYRRVDKLKVIENAQTKCNSENAKYSKTKLPWFSRLIQPSARKQDGGLNLQHTRAHTGQTLNQIKTIEYTAEHGEAESEFLQ